MQELDKKYLIKYNILSKRELEISKYIIEGLTSKEIAKRLFISPRTVQLHRYNLLKKLKVKKTSDAIIKLVPFFPEYFSESNTKEEIKNLTEREKIIIKYLEDYFPEKIEEFLRKEKENKLEILTKREFEISEYIVKGLNSKEIAKKLEISSRTIEHHKRNIFKKLEIKNIAGLVRKLIQEDYIKI